MKRQLSVSVDLSKLKNERPKHGKHYQPTDPEHIANMITHGIWIVPSFYGFKSMQENAASNKEVVTLFIYGMALFCLFTMSTLYHLLSFAGAKGLVRRLFQMGDRAVIYVFIAASYTPWYKSLEVIFYLVVGICPAYAVRHMTDSDGVFELAVGGVIYVAGVLFFKMDGVIPFAHAIWHCFVFAGAISHFYAINKYLVGAHARLGLQPISS